MSKLLTILTTGIAMFAMFFGSGNLVFPLKLGAQTGTNFPIASFGLLLTGVMVPFLGLFGMVLYNGKRDEFFGLLGKWAPFTLSALMLCLMGPFGVVPRCIIVAFGSINVLYPEIPFALFSGIFSLIILAIIYQKNKLIPIIGKFLGPFKIGGIVLIIIIAIMKAPPLHDTTVTVRPFMTGLVEGYQTMDLLAAFFFSITIIDYLRKVCRTDEEALRISFLSSMVGAFLIASVYIGLVVLGAYYGPILAAYRPEQYLATIATKSMGTSAALIIALTMLLACLTTASSLSKLFAEFLRNDLTNKKISWPVATFVTTLVSFLFSLTGFTTISHILGTILEYLYPALILFTLTAIIRKYVAFRFVRQAFWLPVIFSVGYKFF